MTLLLGGRRHDERLDDPVELGRERVVTLGDVLEREPVRHNLARSQVPVPDVFEQPRPLPFHRALIGPQGQTLVHRIAELHHAEHRAIGPHDRDGAALADAVDRPVERDGRPTLQLELGRHDVLRQVAVGFRPHGIDADVRAEPPRPLLHRQDDVVNLGEVDRLRVGERACHLQAVLQVVDDDDLTGPHEPGRPGREQTHRPGAADDDDVALPDVTRLRGEVAGRKGIGEHHGVLVGQPVRDLARPDVRQWHADILGLPSVITTGRVRVAVDPADRGGVEVDVVAVGVQAANAEVAGPAEDVERDHHSVSDLQVLNRRADLVHHTDELVAERVPDPGVWHEPVVQVQVGAADRRELHLHDRVIRMLDRGHVLLLDADPVRAAVDHRAHATSKRCGPRSDVSGSDGPRPLARLGLPDHLTRHAQHRRTARTNLAGMADRPFRFGVIGAPRGDGEQWRATAVRAADLGYGTLLVPDVLALLAPGPTLALAAGAADIRIGTWVYAAPLRTPQQTAWEAHTLSVLTGGRFEMGIGTGHPRSGESARRLGLPFGSAAERLAQVAETIGALRQLDGTERHTPVLVAAGGPKARRLAAEKADIVSIAADALTPRQAVADAGAEVRAAAGERADDIEFASNLFAVGDDIPAHVKQATGADADELVA